MDFSPCTCNHGELHHGYILTTYNRQRERALVIRSTFPCPHEKQPTWMSDATKSRYCTRTAKIKRSFTDLGSHAKMSKHRTPQVQWPLCQATYFSTTLPTATRSPHQSHAYHANQTPVDDAHYQSSGSRIVSTRTSHFDREKNAIIARNKLLTTTTTTKKK